MARKKRNDYSSSISHRIQKPTDYDWQKASNADDALDLDSDSDSSGSAISTQLKKRDRQYNWKKASNADDALDLTTDDMNDDYIFYAPPAQASQENLQNAMTQDEINAKADQLAKEDREKTMFRLNNTAPTLSDGRPNPEYIDAGAHALKYYLQDVFDGKKPGQTRTASQVASDALKQAQKRTPQQEQAYATDKLNSLTAEQRKSLQDYNNNEASLQSLQTANAWTNNVGGNFDMENDLNQANQKIRASFLASGMTDEDFDKLRQYSQETTDAKLRADEKEQIKKDTSIDYAKQQAEKKLSGVDEDTRNLLDTYNENQDKIKAYQIQGASFASNRQLIDLMQQNQQIQQQLKQNGVSDKDLDSMLKTAKTAKTGDAAKKIGNSILYTGSDIAMSPAQGWGALKEWLDYYQYADRNAPVNTNSADYAITNLGNDIENQVGENIGKKSQLGQRAYGIGVSVGKSAVNALVGSAVGEVGAAAGMGEKGVRTLQNVATLPQFGAASFGQTLEDEQDKGVDTNRAIALAHLNGLVEQGTERFSVDHFWDLSPKKGASFIRDWLVQSGIEGSEEYAGNFLDRVAENLIKGDKSNYNNRVYTLEAQGKSEQEAKQIATKEAILDDIQAGIGGTISGLFMGLVGTKTNVNRANYFLNNEDYSQLAEGLEDEKAAGIAGELAEKQKSGKKVTTNDKYRLQNAIDEALPEQIKERGGSDLRYEYDPTQTHEEDENGNEIEIPQQYRAQPARDLNNIPSEMYRAQTPEELVSLRDAANEAAQNDVQRQMVDRAYAQNTGRMLSQGIATQDDITNAENATTPARAYAMGMRNEDLSEADQQDSRLKEAYNTGKANYLRTQSARTISGNAMDVQAQDRETGNPVKLTDIQITHTGGRGNAEFSPMLTIEENGKTRQVSPDQVNIRDGAVQTLINRASDQQTTELAQLYVNSIPKSMPIGAYKDVFNRIRDNGDMGDKTFDEVLPSLEYAVGNGDGKIPVDTAREIFNAGARARGITYEARDKSFKMLAKAGTGTYQDQRQNAGGSLDKYLSETYKTIADATGLDIVLTDNTVDQRSGSYSVNDDYAIPTNANAAYQDALGRVLVNAYSTNAQKFTAIGHEVGEFAQANAPKEAEEFWTMGMDYLTRTMGRSNLEERVRKVASTYGSNLKEASEEVTNNMISMIVTKKGLNEDFVKDSYDNAKTEDEVEHVDNVFTKMVNYIKSIGDHIREFLKTHLNKLSDEERAVYKANAEDIDKLYNSAMKMVTAARENAQKRIAPAETKTETKTETRASLKESNNARYQLKETEKQLSKELDDWDGKNPRTEFDMGYSSNAMNLIGIETKRISLDSSKLIKIKNDHPEMTNSVIKGIPALIQDPVLIMDSATVKDRMVIAGDLYDEAGKPVVAVLELSPSDRNGLKLDEIKIASAYGKDDIQRLINRSTLRYVNPDQKKTDGWLKRTRVQFPVGLRTIGSTGIVAHSSQNVNRKPKKINNNIRVATDSEGNKLTADQKKFFADSKVVDDKGNLMVMYHGTPDGGFTTFRNGLMYFTSNKDYAQVYQSPSASANQAKKQGSNPTTYEVYLNIKNPFDTRKASVRNQYLNDYVKGGWALGIDPSDPSNALMESGYPSWEEADNIYDWLDENDLLDKYDGLILDEGGTESNGYRGLSYVTFNPNQIKSVTNEHPTSDEDIRFSLKEPVEQTKDLIAVHNLTEKELLGDLNLGGMPSPSIAIIKTSMEHNKYGDISVLFNREAIDPQSNRTNKVYGGDAYTPVFPRIEYDLNRKKLSSVSDSIKNLVPENIRSALGNTALDYENATDRINDNAGDVYDAFGDNKTIQYAFLKDTGASLETPMKEAQYSRSFENDEVKAVADTLTDDQIKEMQDEGYAWAKEHPDEVEQIRNKLNETFRNRVFPNGKPSDDAPAFKKRLYNEDIYKDLPFSKFDNLVSGMAMYKLSGNNTAVDGTALSDEIDSAMSGKTDEYKKWLNEKFDGLIAGRGIRNNKDTFTSNDNRRSFRSLHDDVTLENIVKAMNRDEDTGSDSATGFNKFAASAQKNYRSISEIHSDESRLRMISDDDMDNLRKTYSDEFNSIVESIEKGNGFNAENAAVDSLSDAIKGNASVATIQRRLSKDSSWLNLQPNTAQRVYNLAQKIANIPTGYFEAKPKRATYLNEIREVVLPDNSSQELKDALSEKKIPYAEYKAGDNESRKAVLNSFDDARFSLVETDEDGIEHYETSDAAMNMSNKERAKQLVEIMRTQYAGRTAKFWKNGQAYYALYNNNGVKKGAFGDKKSDSSGLKAKLRIGADGNYIELAENALYDGSSAEQGKSNKFHKNAKSWDYYVKTIEADGKYYNVLINVKDTGKDQYVYDITLRQAKKSDAAKYALKRLSLSSTANSNISQSVESTSTDDRFMLSNTSPVQWDNAMKNRYSLEDDSFFDIFSGEEDEDALDAFEGEEDAAPHALMEDSISKMEDVLAASNNALHGVPVSDETISGIADDILKQYKSDYSAEDLKTNLHNFFDYMQNHNQIDYNDMLKVLTEISKPVVEQTSETDPVAQKTYDDFIDTVKKTSIYLSQQERDEVASQYGSYTKFKNLYRGRISLATSSEKGTPIDTVWPDLVAASNGTLSLDTSDMDMPAQLANAIDMLKPTPGTSNGTTLDEESYYAGMSILQKYYDAEVDAIASETMQQTLKDKADAPRIKKALMQNSQNMRRQLNDFKTKAKKEYQQAVESNKAELDRIQKANVQLTQQNMQLARDAGDLKRYKEENARLKKLQSSGSNLSKAQVMALQRDSVSKYVNHQQTVKEKKEITRIANELVNRIENPTTKKHIPQAMQRPIGEFINSIDFISHRAKLDSNPTLKWQEKMRTLSDILAKIDEQDGSKKASQDDDLMSMTYIVDPSLGDRIREFITNHSEEKISRMDASSLHELTQIMRSLRATVNNANTTFMNRKYQQMDALGSHTVSDMRKMPNKTLNMPRFLDSLLNVSMLDSFTWAEEIGPTATSVQRELVEANNIRVRSINEAADAMTKAMQKVDENGNPVLDKHGNPVRVDTSKWSGPNAEVIYFPGVGHQYEEHKDVLRMTPGQIMNLYELWKRKQAKPHILYGGIKIASTQYNRSDIPQNATLKDRIFNVRDRFNGRERIQNYAMHLTESDLQTIFSKLTPEQIRVADAMQQFMANETSKWGNDVTMRMYGYEKFTDPNYFPIRTDSNTIASNDRNSVTASLQNIRNISASKDITPNASNAVIIGDVFDVFSNHIKDMATYRGYTMPMADALRWINYRTQTRDPKTGALITSSVKDEMDRVKGRDYQQYFIKLLLDLNGQTSKGREGSLSETLTSHYKGAAIGGNLRVAIQQPTAYARASLMIDNKYLAKALTLNVKKVVDYSHEAQEKSPIASWKSNGYFDLSLGQSIKSIVTGQQTMSEKIREKTSIAAQWGDDLTWGVLWHAVQLETEDKTNLKPGTAEFDSAVADRFDDIINHTQVVDTLLHRSQFMRSQNSFVKMEAAFQAEPTKSYNMVHRALFKFSQNKSKENTKFLLKTFRVYFVTALLTSIIASVADTFRNDDDVSSWWDRYLTALKDNVIDNANPLGIIPYAKDLISILQGYSIDRMDMQGLTNTVNAVIDGCKYFAGSGTKTGYGVIKSAARGLSQVTGIPVYNIMREVETIHNAFLPNWRTSTQLGADVYVPMDKAISGDGNVTDTTKNLVKKKAENSEKYNGKSAKEANKSATTSVRSHITSTYKPQMISVYRQARKTGNYKEANALKSKIIEAMMATGLTRDEANKRINKWLEG